MKHGAAIMPHTGSYADDPKARHFEHTAEKAM
jgi:hypothetical protein